MGDRVHAHRLLSERRRQDRAVVVPANGSAIPVLGADCGLHHAVEYDVPDSAFDGRQNRPAADRPREHQRSFRAAELTQAGHQFL